MDIKYEDFEKKLKEEMGKMLNKDAAISSQNRMWNMGAQTMFSLACAVFLELENIKMAEEYKQRWGETA